MKLLGQMFRRDGPVSGPWPQGPWAATHKHRKGGLYRLVTKATAEATRTPVAIYDDAEGMIWVRDWDEFHDGRFEAL